MTENNENLQHETDLEAEEQSELLQTDDAKKIIENLLFITDRPVSAKRLAEVVETINEGEALEIVRQLQDEYQNTGRAIQIVEVGGGFQMSTKSEYGRWVRSLYNEKMIAKLSNAALETLAITAYKQPVTRSEIEVIRGVDSGGSLDRLLERGLVKPVGKKDTVGRPMMYGTTDEFLRMFGLNEVAELPELEEFAAKLVSEEEITLPFDRPFGENGESGAEVQAEETLAEAEEITVAEVTEETEEVIEEPALAAENTEEEK